MVSPKFSIITPSFNQGKFLEFTINSVISQDVNNIEYIIIDGGSTDNSVDIIKKHANKLRYWVSKPDKGQTDAINKGLRMASGDIISWINSDDQYIDSHVFSLVADFFDKNPGIYACYGDNIYINENDILLYLRKGVPFYSKSFLHLWDFIHQPTVFLRKQIVEEYLLDESLDLVMDYEYWMRISHKYRFKYSKLLICASRWHASCKTISSVNNIFSELNNVYNKIHRFHPGRFMPTQFFYKLCFGCLRLYSLCFLPQIIKNKSFPDHIKIDSISKLIKRQILGL